MVKNVSLVVVKTEGKITDNAFLDAIMSFTLSVLFRDVSVLILFIRL